MTHDVRLFGRVVADETRVYTVNAALEGDPALVNRDPYGAGWMIKLRVKSPADIDQLLTSEAYKKQIGQ